MNKNKQVLFISPFFFPEQISTGKWNSYVARELSKQVDLTVFCLHPVYPDWKITPSSESIDGMDIVRCGQFLKFPSGSTGRRIILELAFALLLFCFLVKRSKQFDTVILIYPPSLVGLVASLIFKGEIIGVVHDLQGVYANKKTGFLNKFLSKMIYLVEKRSFEICSTLVFLSHEMKDRSARLYDLISIRQLVAYPFVTIKDFFKKEALSEIFNDNQTNVVYSGALGEKQNPAGLGVFLSELCEKNSAVDVHIFSRGTAFEELKKTYSSTRINFHDLVDESDLPELLMRSDVQIIPQATGTSGGSLPSKLPNIIASGAGVFVITDESSELSELLSDVGGVSVCHSWDMSDMMSQFMPLLDITPLHDLQNRSLLLERFSIKFLTDIILPTDVRSVP